MPQAAQQQAEPKRYLNEEEKRREELRNNAWKLAVDNELVSIGSTADSFPDARTAVGKLLDWHVEVALDPKVSKAARNLKSQGYAKGLADAMKKVQAEPGAGERAAFDPNIEDPAFLKAWPEIQKAGYDYGWMGIGLAAWRAAQSGQRAGEFISDAKLKQLGQARYNAGYAQGFHDAGQRAGVVEDVGVLKLNPLTPYGMLVRALRIVANATLAEMAAYVGKSAAHLSAMEFGRKEVTTRDHLDAALFFHSKGIPYTDPALMAAATAHTEFAAAPTQQEGGK